MIYTFYSFKGGVGRSMTLANIAELFYGQGMRVVMVDFDLEAPGLERYFDVKNAAHTPEEIEGRRGVIDMLLSYKELRSLPKLYPEPTAPAKPASEQPTPPFSMEPLSHFIVPIYPAGSRRNAQSRAGSLSIIPAGQRSKGDFERYAQRVRSFGWDDFYSNWDGELFFDWFREALRDQADVVLIDSRTGVTEMSGVCTHQLADVVVIFVAPNKQNIDGVVRIAQSLNNPELIKMGRKGRELSLVFVPSRVEFNEGQKLDQFADQFQIRLAKLLPRQITFPEKPFDYLQVPYVPYYAYTEEVAVRVRSRARSSKMVKAFSNLADVLGQLMPKPSPERARIYVSYRHGAQPDAQLAKEIYRSLSSRHEVFLDSKISVGEAWDEAIERGVREADFFIILLSEQSVASDMLRAETLLAFRASQAQGGRPRVLPIRVNFTQALPYDLGAYLDRIQYADWTGKDDTLRLISELDLAIQRQLHASTQADAIPRFSKTVEHGPVFGELGLPDLHSAEKAPADLKSPAGTMAVDSPFYVARSSDTMAMEAIRSRGVTVTIEGPRQFGKSSLLIRMAATARRIGKIGS